MRRLLLSLVICTLILTGCQKEGEPEVASEDVKEETVITESVEILAGQFMDLIIAGEYQRLVDDFQMSSAMQKAVTPAVYQQSWEGVIAQYGAYLSYRIMDQATAANFTIIPYLVTFRQDKIIVNVVFDEDKLLSGFNFAPYAEETEAPASVVEEDIEIITGSYRMPGKLTLPSGSVDVPLVIIASGSGPNDMDSTIGPNKPLRDIAHGLAEAGIGSIRFTKRTAVYGKVMGDCITIEAEYIEDVVSAYAYGQTVTSVDPDKIFILGHSQGGNLIPMMAENLPEAAGYIIMAGPVTPIHELMLYQYKHLLGKDGEVSTEEEKVIVSLQDGVKNIEALEEDSELSAADLLNIPKEYWLSLKGYDPLVSAKAIEDRLLILQGEKDYQVPMDEFTFWKEALPASEYISYPELNHLFMQSNDTFDSREYAEAQHVDNQVISDIAGFLKVMLQ